MILAIWYYVYFTHSPAMSQRGKLAVPAFNSQLTNIEKLFTLYLNYMKQFLRKSQMIGFYNEYYVVLDSEE